MDMWTILSAFFRIKFKLRTFLDLNKQHHNISFAHGFEADNLLPFLDVLIMHTDNGFSSNLYHKNIYRPVY